ncbi:MAG: N-acetylneuraminate synthase family protein, partial [Candidatus Paceibacterota bacterium]
MIPNNRPYIIGETAFHHMGEMSFLKDLIDHAKNLELDAIKFHLLLDVHDYMVKNHAVIETISNWCFDVEAWKEIIKYAQSKKLDLILLCNDLESIKFVNQLDVKVKAIEIHATGINDIFLLEEASKFKGTVILGTGGSSIDEIQYAIDYLETHNQKDIFLMHGFQNYPTNPSHVKLSRMNILKEVFGYSVGYADHSDPKDPDNEAISAFAAAMGYNVLEKHFTHKFGEERIDSQAAVSLEQMKKIKDLHSVAFKTFGDKPLQMSEAELKYGNTGPMKKAIVAKKDIGQNESLTFEKIAFKRTNESSSLSQNDLPKLMGLKTKSFIKKDE